MNETNTDKANADKAEMISRELAADVATEVMGWQWLCRDDYYLLDSPGRCQQEWRYPARFYSVVDSCPSPELRRADWDEGVPPYTSSLAATWEVETELIRQDLGESYVEHLMLLTSLRGARGKSSLWGLRAEGFFECGPAEVLLLLRASPELRCRAALATVRGEKDKTP